MTAGLEIDQVDIDLGGRVVAVTLRRSARARRMALKVDPANGAVLVLPPRIAPAEARRFLSQHRVWLAERLARLPRALPLADGAQVPLLGRPHLVRHQPGLRRGVWVEDGVLNVCGRPEHLPRRVTDFLKAEARRLMVPQAHDLAARIGRTPGRVSVKDTRSRWGSCSARGDLAFSWRLVMAPDWVLTYVVGHEVAHLAELNHSPAFWRVVDTLVGDPGPAKRWLKAHGPALHRVGASP
ncbi:M48 family metallopeptidase [Magnetospirillum sp. UT-4]|uniref:M48 family metallopeptidase n=1 Tax=Magnetospirillum sp. UT-4 TaxID=2681467 RepID=UPI00138293CC|nr:SprT family zinc-dependent metalloprotease [Magnetospirillum sp. UT-4]CAA7616385.1 Protein containing DUF45 [Magnetospirillum sp. UT-4]